MEFVQQETRVFTVRADLTRIWRVVKRITTSNQPTSEDSEVSEQPTHHNNPSWKACSLKLLLSMKSLPVELMTRIILMGCETLDTDALLRHRWSISAVSSSWRMIALSTQLLWSRIDIRLNSRSRAKKERSSLQMHLERAYSVSLDITLFVSAVSSEDLPSIWDTIFEHLPRCRSIRMAGDFDLDSILPFQMSMGRPECLDIYMSSVVSLPHHFEPALEDLLFFLAE